MDHTLLGTPVDRPTAEMPIVIPTPRAHRDSAPKPIPVPVATSTHPLTGKHALIVGINYAPEPTGTAPYTTAMAEHLAEKAAGVTVITGIPHYPSWAVDPTHKGTMRSRETVIVGGG